MINKTLHQEVIKILLLDANNDLTSKYLFKLTKLHLENENLQSYLEILGHYPNR